ATFAAQLDGKRRLLGEQRRGSGRPSHRMVRRKPKDASRNVERWIRRQVADFERCRFVTAVLLPEPIVDFLVVRSGFFALVLALVVVGLLLPGIESGSLHDEAAKHAFVYGSLVRAIDVEAKLTANLASLI